MDKCTRNEGSLPSEMIYEVFLRLPARSLGRFKCVSKLWLSTISDPQFISSHLDLSRARPKLLISLPSYGVEALMFSADYPEPGNEIMEQGQPHQTLMAEFHGLVLKGDANVEYIGASQASGGLICFGFRSDVTICNPVTGETINHRLPRFPTHSFVKNHFGYDPVEKKYKVLSTWSDITQNCGSFVFTLGEEGWRRLEDYHPTIFRGCTHDDELRSAGVCINGVIYYISYYMEDVQEWGYFHLAAFDLQSETFEVIPLPDKNFGEGMLFLKESAGGSVAVFRLPHILDENNEDDEESDLYNEVEVYTLKDKDLRTWSYECFPVPEGWSGVVVDNFLAGTSHKGELLFVRRIDSGKLELYIYEAETGNRRHTEVHGLHEYECEENSTGSFIRVGDHMETLKSLKGL